MEEEWPMGRSGHVSVAIGNFVLVWGGYTDPPDPEHDLDIYLPPNEVWLYNSESNKWTRHITQGTAPLGLSGAQAVYVANERAIYFVCGFTALGHTNEVTRLDTQTWSWTSVDLPFQHLRPSPRDKFGAWEFAGSVYIFGGYGPDYTPYLHDFGSYFPDFSSLGMVKGWNNQMLTFNPAASSWTNPRCTGSVPSPRAALGAARLGKTVYVFGGRHESARLNDLFSLNLVTLEWTQITVAGDIPVGRSWHSLTPVSDSRLCLFGGYTTDRKTLDDVWYLDIASFRWHQVNVRHSRPRLWHSAACTSAGDVVIFGGCSSDILSNAPTVHTRDILVVRVFPKTLLRLSLDVAYSFKDLLQDQWRHLPHSLSSILMSCTDSSYRCNLG